MKYKYLVIILGIVLVCSCNPKRNELYIRIDGYKLGDTSLEYYHKQTQDKLVELSCASNFPEGTVINVGIGLRKNVTAVKLSEHSYIEKSVVLKQGHFDVAFPYQFIGGFITFAVDREQQSEKLKTLFAVETKKNKSRLYYSEYSIEFRKTKNISESVSIPEFPVQLVITSDE